MKKVELPAGSNPQAELTKAEAQLNEAVGKQYNALSPGHFESAQESLEDARRDIAKGRQSERILDEIGSALGYIREMNANGQKHEAELSPVTKARQSALDVKANTLVKEDFDMADEQLRLMGRHIEAKDFVLNAEEVSSLQKRYADAELAAVKVANLGEARSLIEKAENDGAARRTPKTLETAKAQYESATRSIEANRRAPDAYKAEVAQAVDTSRKLNAVLETTRSAKTSETAALMIYDQQKQIADQQAKIGGAEQSLQALQAKSTEEQRALAGARAQNERYANKEELNQRLANAKQEFDPNEAEVLRDGNNIVVRLKSMRFKPASAELNPDSLGTLRKVKKLIESVPVTSVTIEGHTDSIGSAMINKELSEKRAESVKDYFVSEQIAPENEIRAMGYGFEKPLRSNKSKEGRAINRRVDVVIEPSVSL